MNILILGAGQVGSSAAYDLSRSAANEVTVWRWVPVFVDSGEGRAFDSLVAVGPDGVPPPPFRDMADFRFLCLDREEVVEAGLARATTLAREVEADGPRKFSPEELEKIEQILKD